MDVLSDVLLAVRLSGAVFFDIDAHPPFVTESPPPEAIARRVRADSEVHGRYAEPWTLDRLAGEILMSRSSFAERFADFVGMPPMTYLASWRMQVAARLLRTTTMGLAEIATHVGYQSESAFSRAFKQRVGTAPSVWRHLAA